MSFSANLATLRPPPHLGRWPGRGAQGTLLIKVKITKYTFSETVSPEHGGPSISFRRHECSPVTTRGFVGWMFGVDSYICVNGSGQECPLYTSRALPACLGAVGCLYFLGLPRHTESL